MKGYIKCQSIVKSDEIEALENSYDRYVVIGHWPCGAYVEREELAKVIFEDGYRWWTGKES